ncbi:uncharacterized protein LOC131251202 isoform X2 [Magnolia sinica]|uniref:uncharacterized protein LOC131251202 isoform X2 n=1 Tax=Magnolia sinica TaxID=86752 RepID=UPI0026591245|nr:uncharacterized protein LOC131251202 isoform X2 [Magnolia sinica]XP_058107781.1 uncharacterized protein LOC131251202 isoform X2 [Magnolia sinica]
MPTLSLSDEALSSNMDWSKHPKSVLIMDEVDGLLLKGVTEAVEEAEAAEEKEGDKFYSFVREEEGDKFYSFAKEEGDKFYYLWMRIGLLPEVVSW